MDTVDNTRYAIYMIKYKFAWKTNEKSNINLLEDNTFKIFKKSIYDSSKKYGFVIEDLKITEKFIFLTIKSLPKYSPSEIVNKIKGITGRRIGMEFNMKKIWSRGYLCFTEGKEDYNTLKKYISKLV